MAKYLVKIIYHKIWDENGTVYKKGYKINSVFYLHFYNSLQAEAAMEKDYYRKLWLSASLVSKIAMTKAEILAEAKNGRVYFMNLTQAAYFKSILIKLKANNQLDFNEKRAKYDANTFLLVK